MNKKAQSKIQLEALLKIKQILDAIQKRHFLNSSRQIFDFELGSFGRELKNENDYLELVDIFEGLQKKAGLKYEIIKFYIDARGRRQNFTLYNSFKCKITITGRKKFENYCNKILRQCKFEETNKKIEEQIKPLKKLGKQISLVVHSSSIRNYEEVFKKISEQLTPIKDTLEKVGRLQSTTEYAKSRLTPALQRLATPVKQMEEAMKTLKEYSHPDAEVPIPSDIKRVRQEDKIISRIQKIEALLRELLIENVKNKQKPMPIQIVGTTEVKLKGAKKIMPQPKKQSISQRDNLLYIKKLKPEISVGDLEAYSDGTIRYKKEIIKMRNQLKDLCRLFIRNPNRLLTLDDIRDEIISADRRQLVSFTTISKYVSELHNSLKIHFKKDVIFNQKEEGWYFKPQE